MKDFDPRPMPPTVLAAYRDTLNLTELLASSVFTDSERFAVRDELLDRLVRKHGNVEVEIGKGTRTLPIRKRVAQFRKSVWGSIEVMIAAEELGGREAVMLELASVMQPYWLRWWETMDWSDYDSMQDSMRSLDDVLGSRQLTWLSAQYARSVIDIASASEREFYIDAISAAEAWAIVPSRENRERARLAAAIAAEVASDAYNADFPAVDAARCSFVHYASSGAFRAAENSARFYAAAYATDTYVARSRLCELTKRLITPTLITHASRGIR